MSKIPLFLHIPKCAGTYMLSYQSDVMCERYKLISDHIMIHVMRGSSLAYKILAVIDNKGNLSDQFRYIRKVYHLSLYEVDIDHLSVDDLDIFSIIVCAEGFRSYKRDLYPILEKSGLSTHETVYLRDEFERTKSLYNYIQSPQSSHETTHNVFRFNSLSDYINSDHLEDSWLVKNLLDLPDGQDVTDVHMNKLYDILDNMSVQSIDNIENDIKRVLAEYKGLRYNPKDIALDDSSKHKTKYKNDIKFGELDKDTQSRFKERMSRSYEIYNRYIKPEQPKTSIITIAYDKDLEFLKYNLKSVDRFCEDYINNVVVIDDHKDDCSKTKEYLESNDINFRVDEHAKRVNSGYVRQQWMKLLSERYVDDDAEYVLHIDSDSIFCSRHSPDIWFKDGKPVMLRTSYDAIYDSTKKQGRSLEGIERWQRETSEAMGFKVDYEYMRGMPLVYPKSIFKRVREYIRNIHDCTLIDYFKDKQTFTEYNVLGAYAYQFMSDQFYWITQDDNKEEYFDYAENIKGRHMRHYSSRQDCQPRRYIDLNDNKNPISKLLD